MADFHIYQSKQNPAHFVAIIANDSSANAEGVRQSQNLSLLTAIADDGRPHLGFDSAVAKAAIRDRGFHAFALTTETRDHFE